MRYVWMVSGVLGLVGCTGPDYGVDKLTDPNDATAQLVVEPAQLDLGEVAWGGTATGSFSLSNPGNAGLTLGPPSRVGSGAFSTFDAIEGVELGAGESVDIEVSFTPADTSDLATWSFTSEDLPQTVEALSLVGVGLFPKLEVDPDPVDFGDVLVSCTESQTVTLRNAGTAELNLDNVVLQGERYSLDTELDLPLVLDLDESVDVELSYTPVDYVTDTAALWTSSDEPAGQRQTAVSGDGSEASLIEERFRQPAGPWDMVDFIFYIDQSGSMEDNRRKLGEQSQAFMDHLVDLDLDWKLGVVTRSHGCTNAVISRDGGGTADDFSGMLQGPFDSSTEKGLAVMEAAMEATQPGECNDDFLREDARTAVVFVSDEPDQSPNGWEDHLSAIMSHANGAMLAAIVGELPDGCTGAEPGTGYVEAALATGGMFLSICEDEWADYLEEFASLVSQEPTGTWPLAYEPEPDTIVVLVDEVEVSAWTYDADENAVVFDDDAWPSSGAEIDITYVPAEICG